MIKHLIKLSLFLALLGPLLATAANAAATRIECPISQARTEMITPLPSGWWQTPYVSNLDKTKVGTVGGKPTLMCGYSAYGATVWVMHLAPDGANCVADATGFTCTTPLIIIPGVIQPIGPVTYSTGSISLKQTWMMDLDNGTSASGPGNDIWFRAVTADLRYLEPQNGAKIALAGTGGASLQSCKSLTTYTTGQIPLHLLPVGMYVCVITDEGRYSSFRVNSAPGPSPGTMEIGYTTWAN